MYTTVEFALRSFIKERQSREFRFLSVRNLRSAELVFTSLEMTQACGAKPTVKGSTEKIVGP